MSKNCTACPGIRNLGGGHLCSHWAKNKRLSARREAAMLTITMGLGILVSVILHAFTGLSAGGFVSSGYVALVLDQPVTLMTVAAISVLIWLLVLEIGRASCREEGGGGGAAGK